MTFGWEVFNASGVQIAGSRRLLRFAYFAKLTANGSASVPGMLAANALWFVYPVFSDAIFISPFPTISVTDGNVAWSRSSWGVNFVYFLFVLQWK